MPHPNRRSSDTMQSQSIENLRDEYERLVRQDVTLKTVNEKMDLLMKAVLGNGNMESSIMYRLLVIEEWVRCEKENREQLKKDTKSVLLPIITEFVKYLVFAVFMLKVTGYIP